MSTRFSRFLDPRPDGSPRVKICGLTNADDARWAVLQGADAIGVNFWPRSKRYLDPALARPWLEALAGQVLRVAVFVNAPVEEVREMLQSGLVDAAQLHGDESPSLLETLLAEGHAVYKALGVRDRRSLDEASTFPGDALLLDAYNPTEYGGTGRTMNWALGREAVLRWPDRAILLAGGLTPHNVDAAVAETGAFGVDVASGVEISPGIKDPEKVAAFIKAL
ncbi:MAG: phosphoribosylanthranilate isomerase [Verrucomicrobiales bacterium]|nr:phosphoribosylanthranilate isomerase [Verrucomicrobiales bacterium]